MPGPEGASNCPWFELAQLADVKLRACFLFGHVGDPVAVRRYGHWIIGIVRSKLLAGSTMEVRMTDAAEGALLVPRLKTRVAPNASKRTAPAKLTYMSIRFRNSTTFLPGQTVLAACAPASAIHVNSRVRSAAFCHRSSGFFARHDLTMRSSAGGVTG